MARLVAAAAGLSTLLALTWAEFIAPISLSFPLLLQTPCKVIDIVIPQGADIEPALAEICASVCSFHLTFHPLWEVLLGIRAENPVNIGGLLTWTFAFQVCLHASQPCPVPMLVSYGSQYMLTDDLYETLLNHTRIVLRDKAHSLMYLYHTANASVAAGSGIVVYDRLRIGDFVYYTPERPFVDSDYLAATLVDYQIGRLRDSAVCNLTAAGNCTAELHKLSDDSHEGMQMLCQRTASGEYGPVDFALPFAIGSDYYLLNYTAWSGNPEWDDRVALFKFMEHHGLLQDDGRPLHPSLYWELYARLQPMLNHRRLVNKAVANSTMKDAAKQMYYKNTVIALPATQHQLVVTRQLRRAVMGYVTITHQKTECVAVALEGDAAADVADRLLRERSFKSDFLRWEVAPSLDALLVSKLQREIDTFTQKRYETQHRDAAGDEKDGGSSAGTQRQRNVTTKPTPTATPHPLGAIVQTLKVTLDNGKKGMLHLHIRERHTVLGAIEAFLTEYDLPKRNIPVLVRVRA